MLRVRPRCGTVLLVEEGLGEGKAAVDEQRGRRERAAVDSWQRLDLRASTSTALVAAKSINICMGHAVTLLQRTCPFLIGEFAPQCCHFNIV